jgi:hypothetical protein
MKMILADIATFNLLDFGLLAFDSNSRHLRDLDQNQNYTRIYRSKQTFVNKDLSVPLAGYASLSVSRCNRL